MTGILKEPESICMGFIACSVLKKKSNKEIIT